MADTSSHEHGSPWSQRGFVFAAALVAVIVAAGLALLFAGIGSDDDTTDNGASQKGAGAPPAATQTAEDPGASVCGLSAGSQATPSVPPEAKWELVGTVAVPSSPGAGPGIKQGKLRACYAHSPTGALFAAANFIGVAANANDSPDVLRRLTAPSPARDASLKRNAGSSNEGSSGGLQIAGFQVSSYSGDEATVDLAFSVEGKGYARLPISLRWQRGDWKVVVTTPEGPFAGVETLQNLSGYVPWSGT